MRQPSQNIRCCLLSVLFLAACLGSNAQPHPLTSMPPSAPGVTFRTWFPDHYTLNFPAGDQVEAVVGLHNGGDETYNVTAIFGSLNAAHDFRLHFQNFSGMPYQDVLRPSEQVSLAYPFYTATNLPPREFLVALTVFYQSDTQQYATTFFNKTIDIIEQRKWLDLELIFLWLLLLSLAGGAGWLGYQYLGSLGYIKKARKSRPAWRTESTGPQDNTEWLKGTFYGSTKPSRKGSKELKRGAEGKAAL